MTATSGNVPLPVRHFAEQRLQLTGLRVGLIVGPCEPGTSGVVDYTWRLANALRQAGTQVDVVSDGNWRLGSLPSLLRLVRQSRAHILHMQYPSSGFGHKLGPQGVSLLMPCVVTIHEATKSHPLRKLSLYPFSLRARHVIFTNESERQFGVRWAPWIARESSVIPIGSNIAAQQHEGHRCRREIIHFGLIMPKKGLEQVLDLAAMLKASGESLVVRIIGNRRPEHLAYAERLQRMSRGLPVVWQEGLSEREVGVALASSLVAYLPFPDGASERRGSLKAALTNGMAIVTTEGADTPPDLQSVVRLCSSPREALAVIRDLVRDPARATALGDLARRYAERFSWETIARSHLALYERLTGWRCVQQCVAKDSGQ